MPLLLQLFWEFAKIGFFAIGGGMATIPFLSKLADATGWFTQTDLLNMIAVSESTPGPIGVNTATYVGYHIAGIAGGIIATLGLITPSIIVILIISQFLKKFGDSKIVKDIMYGLRAASAGLIAAACFLVAKVTLFDSKAIASGNILQGIYPKAMILAVILLFFTNYGRFKKIHPVGYLAIAAVVGVVFHFAG